jgi:hypothetical protein
MRHSLAVAAAAVLLAASVASAQTSPTTTQSTDHQQPGAGGVSKARTPGLPGNKSGPSTRQPSGSTTTGSSGSTGSGITSGPGSANPGPVNTGGTQMQDQAKVPGLPGNKSGSSLKEPGQSEKK